MADKKGDVVVAVEDVTLNRKLGEKTELLGQTYQATDSVNLGPGDSVPLDELVDELRERVDAGEVPQVRVMSADQAEELKAKAQEASAPAPPGFDTSFSNHLVADVERAANLHATAVAESGGEVVEDSEPEVVGDDSANSPASSGRRTASDAGDDVEEAVEKAKKSK